MGVKKVRLKNFRNYIDEEICLSDNVTLIYGENAQGKTNIIEALYLFSTGKSHRTNNNNELIRHGESFFDISLEFEDNNYRQSMNIIYEKGNKKRLFINEVKKERMSDVLGVIPSVLFSPESLSCIKGSPGERRRTIDIVLCQISKKYLYNLQKYNKIVKNKNVLLKEKQLNPQLDIWNESQAKTGTAIIEERRELLFNIEKRMKRIMHGISEGKEDVSIRYRTYSERDGKDYESLLELLNEKKEKEMEQGVCLYGPHRDEIEIFLNNRNSRYYCSQGQQRSLALAMNIAVMEEIEEKTGKEPVLLLDDVMSELDEKRRKFLYELIRNKQAVITSTERAHLNMPIDNNILYIQVKDGKVIETS